MKTAEDKPFFKKKKEKGNILCTVFSSVLQSFYLSAMSFFSVGYSYKGRELFSQNLRKAVEAMVHRNPGEIYFVESCIEIKVKTSY